MPAAPLSDRLRRIVANLRRHVPAPPPPIARPTASFATLRVGQRLRSGDNEWEVTAVDSLGATLKGSGVAHRITDRAWKNAGWSRVRAPRKRATP